MVQLLSPQGEMSRPPGSSTELPVTAEAREVARRGEGEMFFDDTVDGVHLLVLTAGLGDAGAIQVARPLTETDNVLDRVLVLLIVVGLVGVALAALLGALVARTALAPIARFTRAPRRWPGHRTSPSASRYGGRDELARLASSFNTTLDALERAVEAQRQLVADASHELRTPIASVRANIETLEYADRLPSEELSALRADILSELDELTALVGDVVELARGEKAGEALDDVRLDTVVTALIERARRRGDPRVEYSASLEPTLVRGEPDRISRAVGNLLDNARRWSPEGGVVEVTLRDGTLTVQDRGPGFAEADLGHVFERFYRSRGRPRHPGLGARAGYRAPGGGGPWGLRRGGQRARRRGRAEGALRGADRRGAREHAGASRLGPRSAIRFWAHSCKLPGLQQIVQRAGLSPVRTTAHAESLWP